jgi:hypothetical protein
MTALPTLGGNNSFATGANNLGQVARWAETATHDLSLTGLKSTAHCNCKLTADMVPTTRLMPTIAISPHETEGVIALASSSSTFDPH